MLLKIKEPSHMPANMRKGWYNMKRINKELLARINELAEEILNLDRHNDYHENGVESDDITPNGRFKEAKEIDARAVKIKLLIGKFSIDV